MRDGALQGGGPPAAAPPPYHVFAVAPGTAFGFATDGSLNPTRWRF